MKRVLINNNNIVVEIISGSDNANENIRMSKAPDNIQVGDILNEDNISNDDLNAQYIKAITNLLNQKARSKNYKDEFSIVGYVNSTNADWKQEATDFIAWRDACWQYAIDVQTQVESQEIEQPSLEDFINSAPQLIWSE